MKNKKTETIKEFLKRGGKVTKLDYVKPEEHNIVRSTTLKVPTLYNLVNGADMFCDKIKRNRKKQKKQINIDVNMLPEELKHLVEQQDD